MLVVLTVSDGPEEGRKLTLVEGQSIVVGREAPADVVIADDGYMSGRHFTVEVTGGTVLLRDLESRNKTKVNGQFVREISLTAGDIVLAGHTEFLVDIQSSSQRYETTLEDVDPEHGGRPPAGPPATPPMPVGSGETDVPRSPQGQDVFDSPFDEPAPNVRGAIGDPGVNKPAVSDASHENALPPSSAKKKSSASPIQSMTGSGSPLFGGGDSAQDSGFGNPFGDAPAKSGSGSSPFVSVGADPGVGPVNPLHQQPPPAREVETHDAGLDDSFDPNTPTTGRPLTPKSDSSGSDTATEQDDVARPTPPASDPTSGRSAPTGGAAAAGSPGPVVGGAPADRPAAPVTNEERARFIADKSTQAPPLPDVYRNCVRGEATSGLATLVAAGDGETPLHISGLLQELQKSFHVVLSIHCQKIGKELPQELWTAVPLFSWLPRETSLFYCPVAIPLSQVTESGHLALLDELWGCDGMVIFLAKRSVEEGLQYIGNLPQHKIPGISMQGNFMGFAWPSVIGQMLQNQPQDVVADILGDQLGGVVTESADTKGWQFIGEPFMVDELAGLPLNIGGPVEGDGGDTK